MRRTPEFNDRISKVGPTNELQQVGVLPWRIRRNGEPRILLITSRGRGRWIVPKGWPKRGSPPVDSASREAFEEAGIIGDIHPAPVTEYRYVKALDDGSEVSCRVTVFGMNVRGTLSHWREKQQRQRQWFSLEAAADKLDDAELAAFVRAFAPERLKPSRRFGGGISSPMNRNVSAVRVTPMRLTALERSASFASINIRLHMDVLIGAAKLFAAIPRGIPIGPFSLDTRDFPDQTQW